MNPLPFYITGIGMSAGGINALKLFFQNIEEKPGTAFIIIQHLSPDQKGFTKDLLKGIVDLPLVEVKGRTKIKIDHIYLIPPTDFLLLEDQHLILKKRTTEKKINDAINVFFESLAKHASEKAIGIIFSGLGSDGAKGAQRIKEMGGFVMVQSPETASFSSMPLEAIISDHPDVIASPDQIAKELLHFTKHPFHLSTDSLNAEDEEKGAVEKIISLVNEFSGVNFRDYKKNTILRRIDKRLKINYKRNIKEYCNLLGERPDEIRTLYNDLLIGVTEFFRDREAFELLNNKVIPELCHNREGLVPIRIWVAGCSTGEEAYSVAMLLDNYITENHLLLDFKVFATDLDQKAIELARRGSFSKQVELQVPEKLLKAYFTQRGEFYEIIHELRKKIIFSVHNLLNDPPFIRMDLVTCRNLFIYLNGEVQKKILYTFNYALRNHGFLMIGAHENQADLVDLFETVDYRWKIFKNKSRSSNSISEIIHSSPLLTHDYPEIKLPRRTPPDPINHQYEFFAELLLEKYAPACIVLTERNEVVYVTEDAEDLLTFPKRKSNLNLFDMVNGSTALALRSGISKIKEEKRNVVLKNVKSVTKEEGYRVSDFFFHSIYSKSTGQKYVLIEINPVKKNKEDPEFIEISTRENLKEIARLEAELEQAKRELQYNSDELETINEELQSSNEEMKSSNEEMQTTNEELQSSNEELKTVNFELKSKIEEITVLHDDVQNLFISTQIATLFLDRSLKIRKFTPAVQAYFNIRENDIGRPIYHYTYNFRYDGWEREMETVLQTLQPVQKEVKTNNGYALTKIIPYKTDDRRIDGVVMTFVDVTEMKEAHVNLEKMTNVLKSRSSELEQSEKLWKFLVENTPDVVARIDENATIIYVNQSVSLLGIDPANIIGKNISAFQQDSNGGEENSKTLNRHLRQVILHKKALNFHQNFLLGNTEKNFYLTLIPEWSANGNDNNVLMIGRDITHLQSTEKSLEEKNSRLATMNQNMDSFMHAVAHDFRSPIANLKLILGLLSDEQSKEKRDLLIEKLDHSVVRLDIVLNSLIEIIDSHVNNSEKERRISFSSIIQKVLGQLQNDIPEDALIEYNIQVEEINYIRGYMSSIIRNLISNSIKYRKKETPLVIQVETWEEEDYKILSIEDNGIGMDLDEVKKDLFMPFKRLSTDGEGRGVGLHLVRSMVEKTGGKIQVDSEKGKGCKFYVYLKDLG